MEIKAAQGIGENAVEALRNVYDPELGINIIDLGLVYGINVDENGFATIRMTLTIPGCPMHDSIGNGVAAALDKVPGITGGDIQLVWTPPWEPSFMSAEARRMLGYS